MDPGELECLRTYWRSIWLLIALAKLGRSAGETELAALLGAAGTTVRKHLKILAEAGLVERLHKHNGYALTRSGQQMIQMETEQTARNSVKPARKFVGNARFDGSTSSAFNSRKMDNREAEVSAGVKTGQNERKSVIIARISGQNKRFDRFFFNSHSIWRKRNKHRGARAADPPSDLEVANLAALRAEGLGSNHRVRRICRLAHVTPDYIAGQARRLRQEHRFAVALLLHIVESGDPLPRQFDDDEEDRSHYFSGPYADIIEH